MARYSSPSGMLGKRTGCVSKVDTLKPTAPAATNSSISSRPPVLAIVAQRATSVIASRSTSFVFLMKASTFVMGVGSSYGMSTIVVTPPAAAAWVARVNPSAGSLRVCTWASTTPGITRWRPASILSSPVSAPGSAIAAIRPSSTPRSPSTSRPSGRTRRPATTSSNLPRGMARSLALFHMVRTLSGECSVPPRPRRHILGSLGSGGVHPAGEGPAEGFELRADEARLGDRRHVAVHVQDHLAERRRHRDVARGQHMHGDYGEDPERRVEAAADRVRLAPRRERL